ncbi:MAG: cbb3-type cytochrome c oxidase subunit 3 [Burkholderiaceae bacterium]|jgi:cytochrome c oxidase cbb3-type subunit 4
MDINLIREVVTVLSFLIFAGILYWARDSLNDKKFHDASLVPLEDDGLESEEQS